MSDGGDGNTNKIYWDQGWNYIEKAITRMKNILEGVPEENPINQEELSFLSWMVCQMSIQNEHRNYAGCLYIKYKEALEEYCIASIFQCLREKQDEYVLRQFVKRWKNYKIFVKWLSRVFQYLDCFYVTMNALPTLCEVGLDCFRKLAYQKMKSKITYAVLLSIKQERHGENVDKTLLKEVLDIFIELGSKTEDYYKNDFEAEFIAETTFSYFRIASTFTKENLFPDYVIKADEFIKLEIDMLSRFLPNSTIQKVAQSLQQEFFHDKAIRQFKKTILAFQKLLKENKVCEDLSRMYNMFSRIPNGLLRASKVFKKHVTFEGMALVEEARDAARRKKTPNREVVQDEVLIWNIFNLHDEYSIYLNNCFKNNFLMQMALKEAFVLFCNNAINGILIVEMLATFSDRMLRRCNREKINDESIQDLLKNIVTILDYINDKDLFVESYRKMLVERLLGRSLDYHDYEKRLIAKLKHQFGEKFTSRLEGMLKDLTLCKEPNMEFKEYIDSKPHVNPEIDLSVTVLAAGSWATYKPSNLNLPAEMERCVKAYEEFYLAKNKNRKLNWIFSLGTCKLTGIFGSKTVELVATTYQTSILLLFNSSDRLSFTEIMTQLNLNDDELIGLLCSLSGSKYKLLNKEPDSESISQEDYFELNAKFADNKPRQIKMPLPEVIHGKTKTIEEISNDRRYAIDAAIVRIIKKHKVLSHQKLVGECVEQLSPLFFKPDIKTIKKRVEDLIDRDYLERDKDEFNLLRYIP